jgi:hypothetical protein
MQAYHRGAVVMACTKLMGHEISLRLHNDFNTMKAKLSEDDNSDEDLILSTHFSLKTSQDTGLPSGHLVVTPSLTVKFSETRVISYNLTECKSHSETIITWALESNANTNSFNLKGQNDIIESEVWCG